jgi:diguanylate cyclase (GGDEF)-like protein
MKLFLKYKKQLWLSFGLFVLLITIGGLILYIQSYNQKKNFIQRKLKEETLLFNSTLHELNSVADSIYYLQVDTKNIIDILKQAQDKSQRDKARIELYNELKDKYHTMKLLGIRQLHFHLPNSISFLRFHRPKKYGDSLKGVRPAIDLVNKTKEVKRGFEEGRVFNGFRNVYPIFDKTIFLGTVEVSFASYALTKNILSIEKGYYGLLVRKKTILKKVWKNEQKNYYRSFMTDEYRWDKESLDYMMSVFKNFSFDDLKAIEENIKDELKQKLKLKKDFLISFSYKNKDYIAIFKHIKNLYNEDVAVFVSSKRDDFFKEFYKNITIYTIGLVLSALLSSFLFFIYLKKNYDFTKYLEEQSHLDPLTNLLNRRGFLTAIKSLTELHKREKQPYSILFLDIDHFKEINDKYGHDVGDEVLKLLSDIMKNTLRESDMLVRWGGEEFVVFLNKIDTPQALKVAEKLRNNIENYKSKKLPSFTISVGVAKGDGVLDVYKVITKADEALYRAKKNGRNRVEIY